jgi:hypothetical protein
MPYHIAQISPLVQKVSVNIDRIRLRQILGYQLPYRIKVDMFLLEFILDVSQAFLVTRLRRFFGHRMSPLMEVDGREDREGNERVGCRMRKRVAFIF